jgi:hypothetical protein
MSIFLKKAKVALVSIPMQMMKHQCFRLPVIPTFAGLWEDVEEGDQDLETLNFCWMIRMNLASLQSLASTSEMEGDRKVMWEQRSKRTFYAPTLPKWIIIWPYMIRNVLCRLLCRHIEWITITFKWSRLFKSMHRRPVFTVFTPYAYSGTSESWF